jgi:hypothetical protein
MRAAAICRSVGQGGRVALVERCGGLGEIAKLYGEELSVHVVEERARGSLVERGEKAGQEASPAEATEEGKGVRRGEGERHEGLRVLRGPCFRVDARGRARGEKRGDRLLRSAGARGLCRFM